MPKFYVTCGSQSMVLTAESAEQAAMSLIDSFLGAHIWIYQSAELTEADCRAHIACEALMHLGHEVNVSERGFGKTEAGAYGVPELIHDWHRLMISIGKLLVAAGLDGDRCLPTEPAVPPKPRAPK